MKRTYKNYTALALVLGMLFPLAAREEPVADFEGEYNYDNTSFSDEDILLPGLTTTVSGDSMTAGRDALPDFSTVVHSVPNDSSLLPKLPDVTMQMEEQEAETETAKNAQRAISAQGLLGGGYPGYFLGDFSVYKSSGEDPFLLQFSHVSANGYGQHSAGEGFFDSTTKLLGEKKFTWGQVESKSSIAYTTNGYGLQGQCAPSFYNMTYQTIYGTENFVWHIPHGFELDYDIEGKWYKRYAGVLPSDSVSYESYQSHADALSFDPKLTFKWSNNSFEAYVDAIYNMESLYSVSDTPLNRGQFDAKFGWHNDSLSLDAKGGVVLAKAEDGTLKVLPPFSVNFAGDWRVGASYRLLSVSAAAGIDSVMQRSAELESKYLFASLSTPALESTDWFAEASASIPLFTALQLNADVEFKTTAFGNCIWEADYTSASTVGLYSIVEKERTLFDTDLSLTYAWKLYKASVFWKQYWGSYIPSLEPPCALGVVLGAQSDSGVWGASLTYRQPLGNGVDMVPDFSLEGYYRMLDSLRLAVELNDAVKLFTGTDRSFAGSAYLSRAGSATLLVRFFF